MTGLQDLAMGGQRADPKLVIGFDDPVQPADAAEVDDDGRGGQAELEERQQAVAAREDLGLSLALLQHPQDGADVPRPRVVELAWDHRDASSSS